MQFSSSLDITVQGLKTSGKGCKLECIPNTGGKVQVPTIISQGKAKTYKEIIKTELGTPNLCGSEMAKFIFFWWKSRNEEKGQPTSENKRVYK